MSLGFRAACRRRRRRLFAQNASHPGSKQAKEVLFAALFLTNPPLFRKRRRRRRRENNDDNNNTKVTDGRRQQLLYLPTARILTKKKIKKINSNVEVRKPCGLDNKEKALLLLFFLFLFGLAYGKREGGREGLQLSSPLPRIIFLTSEKEQKVKTPFLYFSFLRSVPAPPPLQLLLLLCVLLLLWSVMHYLRIFMYCSNSHRHRYKWKKDVQSELVGQAGFTYSESNHLRVEFSIEVVFCSVLTVSFFHQFDPSSIAFCNLLRRSTSQKNILFHAFLQKLQ